MIQRIQSLYLLGGAVAILATIFIPFSRVIANDIAGYLYLHTCKGDVIFQNTYNPMLLLFTGIVTAVSFVISIFLFKNRVKQMRFNAFVFILNCLLIGAMFFIPERLAEAVDGRAYYKEIGIIMPLISMVLLVFANKAIRKDEMKVRAADRLR